MKTLHALYKTKVKVYTEKKKIWKNSEGPKQRSAVADKHKRPRASAAQKTYT
jgi:hypothetical protein